MNKPMIDFKLDENGKYRYVIINGRCYSADEIEYAPDQLSIEEIEAKEKTE